MKPLVWWLGQLSAHVHPADTSMRKELETCSDQRQLHQYSGEICRIVCGVSWFVGTKCNTSCWHEFRLDAIAVIFTIPSSRRRITWPPQWYLHIVVQIPFSLRDESSTVWKPRLHIIWLLVSEVIVWWSLEDFRSCRSRKSTRVNNIINNGWIAESLLRQEILYISRKPKLRSWVLPAWKPPVASLC